MTIDGHATNLLIAAILGDDYEDGEHEGALYWVHIDDAWYLAYVPTPNNEAVHFGVPDGHSFIWRIPPDYHRAFDQVDIMSCASVLLWYLTAQDHFDFLIATEEVMRVAKERNSAIGAQLATGFPDCIKHYYFERNKAAILARIHEISEPEEVSDADATDVLNRARGVCPWNLEAPLMEGALEGVVDMVLDVLSYDGEDEKAFLIEMGGASPFPADVARWQNKHKRLAPGEWALECCDCEDYAVTIRRDNPVCTHHADFTGSW